MMLSNLFWNSPDDFIGMIVYSIYTIFDQNTRGLSNDFELGVFFQQIYPSWSHKVEHFQKILQGTGVPYKDMLFFDDEDRNIRSVSCLGHPIPYWLIKATYWVQLVLRSSRAKMVVAVLRIQCWIGALLIL